MTGARPKIVFLATPDFAAELLEYIISNQLAEVRLVFTQKNKPCGRGKKRPVPYIEKVCSKYKIPLYQTAKVSTPEYIELIKKMQIDIGFIIAFGQLLSKSFYSVPKYGMFNLHFSLLPLYRGASPLQSAILNGDKQTGVTIQKITNKLDSGDISLQKRFSLEKFTFNTALSKAQLISRKLLATFFTNAPETYTILTPQNHSQATYCKKIEKASGLIKKSYSLTYIRNMIRAYNSWPGTYFYLKNIKYDITLAGNLTDQITHPQLALVRPARKKLYLANSCQALEILKIKKQNKKELDTVSFLNGSKINFPAPIKV